jgi:hypothetical protein
VLSVLVHHFAKAIVACVTGVVIRDAMKRDAHYRRAAC